MTVRDSHCQPPNSILDSTPAAEPRETAVPAVLFVDDDQFVVAAMRRMLRRLSNGVCVTFCHSASEALKVLPQHVPELIISDLQMPGISGSDFLQRVAVEFPTAVRIALSGQSDPEREVPISCIVHRFLPKPCNPVSLKKTIEQLVAARAKVGDDRVLAFCHSLTSVPAGPLAQQELAQWSDGGRKITIDHIVNRDLGLAINVLRLASFARQSPFEGLPSEALAGFRSDTIDQLLAPPASDDGQSQPAFAELPLPFITTKEGLRPIVADWYAELHHRWTHWLRSALAERDLDPTHAENTEKYLSELWQLHNPTQPRPTTSR